MSDEKSEPDVTELVDIEEIRRQAQGGPAGLPSRKDRVAKGEKQDATEHFSLADLPAHMRPPAAPPKVRNSPPKKPKTPMDIDHTEEFDVKKLRLEQEKKDGLSSVDKPQPSWLLSSQAVDLGRPQSGAPKEVEGTRRGISDLNLPELPSQSPYDLDARTRSKTTSSWKKKTALAGMSLAFLWGVLWMFWPSEKNDVKKTNDEFAQKPAALTTSKSKNNVASGEKQEESRKLEKKNHVDTMPDYPNDDRIFFLKSTDKSKASQLLVVAAADFFAGKKIRVVLLGEKVPVKAIAVELKVPLLEMRFKGGKDRMQAECTARVVRKTDVVQVGAAATVGLKKGDETIAREKSLRQCAQKMSRKLLRALN